MAKITEITVSAGRVIPHPFQRYANLRPMITLKAEVEPGEDPTEAARGLQAKAEGLIEDHARYMVRSLEELEDLSRLQSKVASLEASIRRAQEDLDRLRREMPALADLSERDEPKPSVVVDTYEPSEEDSEDDIPFETPRRGDRWD